MAILRLRTIGPSPDHEALFLERYQRLLVSALQLTEGDRDRAEDLVHDAFIQFTLSRPDLHSIESIDAYLYGILRKLHLSQMRRESRSRIQRRFVVEYDSAETGLLMIDPHDRLQAQEELRRVCRYACMRKETSKAGSILILRFFHGYYPSEITKVIRGSRQAVDLRLRRARAEARASLTDPESLVFINGQPAPHVGATSLNQSTVELLFELCRTIFRSCRGECLPQHELHILYDRHSERPIATEVLAHIVSCQFCLDEVNKMQGLQLLSERYAVDTMGKDDSSKGGGSGDGRGGTAADKEAMRCKRRAREVFEHRPQELHISVNGFIQGSQKINSEQSDLTLNIDMAEQIGFVEIFSEQETRLLFLDVEPPPFGAVEQRARVNLSNQRTLELTLSFRGPWPTLQTIYHDPLLRADRKAVSDLDDEPVVTSESPQSTHGSLYASVARQLRVIRETISNSLFWFRPGTVTVIIAVLLVALLFSLYLRKGTPALTAAEVLLRSSQADEAAASRPATVLHKVLRLDERSSQGDLISRNRIEVWQSAERRITARRLYDEQNKLIAGDWRGSDGVQMLYHHGAPPQLQLGPDKGEALTGTNFESVWQLSPSAKDFSTMIGGPEHAHVVEGKDSYVLSYEKENRSAGASGLIRAALVIRRHDFHPVEQTLTISNGKEWRGYHFIEISFESRAASTVEPSMFEPDPELTGLATERAKLPLQPLNTEKAQPLTALPTVATAELEVEVLRLLQAAGADMGEQVSVTRGSDGVLRVEGIVDTPQRKAEILQAVQPVANNPAVRIDVQTVGEVLKLQSQNRRSSNQSAVETTEARANTLPAEIEMRRYFAGRGFSGAQIDEEIKRFSNRMLDQSRTAMAHAWALKRLAQRFSPEQLSALDSDARAKWLSLVGEHVQALTQSTASLHQELQYIFPETSSGDRTQDLEITNEKHVISSVERLFSLCADYNQAIRAAFIISAENTKALAIRTPNFWRSLRAAERLALTIHNATRRLRH